MRTCYTKHLGQDKDKEFVCQLFPSSQAQLRSQLFYHLIPLSGAEGWRRAVINSCFVSAALSFSHFSPAPVQDPSHGRQLFSDFSNMGHSCELYFLRNCYSVRPFHRVQSRNRLRQCALLLGSQVLSEKLGSSPSLHLPSRHIHPLCHGALHSLQDICSTGCRWTSSQHMEKSPPSFFTDLGVYGAVCLTLSQSSLTVAVQQFLPFCMYVTTEILPVFLASQWQDF